MSRSTEDGYDSVASMESASSSNDEGSKYFTRDGAISPPDEEKYEAAQIELLRTTTDCGGYVASMSSAAEIQEGEKVASIPPSEMQVNLLEKTRIWKNRQLRELQYDSLKYYYNKMMGRTVSFNWYRRFDLVKRFDDVSCKKPEMIEDLPCECDLEEERKIPENIEGCKREMEMPTKQESSAEEFNISIKSPIQKLAKHNNTCNVRRICQYFSCIAKYFIEEEVDPDVFLYIPFPKGKYGEDSVDYKYYILQESRKILILKLWEGLRKKLESWVEGMTKIDKVRYECRNEVRIGKHLILNNLLEDLLKPYENFTYTKENDDNNNSKQNPSKQIADQIDQDKSKYLLLKAEYQSLKKRLEKEASERRNEELIDDALQFDFYISYEEFLEQEKSRENKPSTSKDTSEHRELYVEKSMETEQTTDEPESERKMSASEQEAEVPESKRKKNDSEPRTHEPKSKRKTSDLEEAEEPEGKRKKGDSEEETEEPEFETKMDESEQETEEKQGKRNMDDSDQETEEREIKRKREGGLPNENS